VKHHCPAQCTLVPDDPGQLTSDHGWDIGTQFDRLSSLAGELKSVGVRVSLFVDFDCPDLADCKAVGADRIELYTEPYAQSFGKPSHDSCFEGFRIAAEKARRLGLGVNAGHDLNLQNLGRFLEIPGILEVSIGHAFITECIELGIEQTMQEYLRILHLRPNPS
jgi:pyridoxine 5-phosphate synthase